MFIHVTSKEKAEAILAGGYVSSYDVRGNEDELIYAEDGMIQMLSQTGRHEDFLSAYEEESDDILELAGLWEEEFKDSGQVVWVTTDGEAWGKGAELVFTPPAEAKILYRKFTSIAFYVPGDRIPPGAFTARVE